MENKKYLKEIPSIFGKKLNNTNKSKFIKESNDHLKKIRHYSPSNKEWLNTVYAFNNNSIKNLPIYYNILEKIMESYFNLFLNTNNDKLNRIIIKKKRLSVNRIFFSKPEIKHTNDKINITVYVYNEEKRLLLLNLMKVLNTLNAPISKDEFFNSFTKYSNDQNIPLNIKQALNPVYNSKETISLEYLKNYLMSSISLQKEYVNILSKSFKLEEKINILKNIFKEYNNINVNLLKNKLNENIIKKIEYLGELNAGFTSLRESKISKRVVGKILGKLWKSKENYEELLNINNSKFKYDEKGLLYKLSLLIRKIYKKKVEFNFVNIKNIYLNSDIFTQVIALKLKQRKISTYKVFKSSFHLVKLPNINRLKFKYGLGTLLKKVNKKNINNTNNTININTLNKDVLNSILLESFPHEKKNINNNTLEKIVLNSLYHKAIVGIRIETKGRLTKRFTASRSVFKVKWKGTLKDVYASYRGLSSTMLRGHFKSNMQYTNLNTKGRNGAFGIKGWINNSNY